MDLYRRRKIDAHVDMTPMIDTLLQLFMIFLFGATFISSAVKLNLPKASSEQKASETIIKEVIVSIDSKNEIYVNSQPVLRDQLKGKVQSMLLQAKEPVVTLLADRNLRYEQIMDVMVEIQNTGATNVRLGYDQKAKHDSDT